MRAWLASLVVGPDGKPDEGAVAFVMAQILLFVGTIYNTIHDQHFATETLVGAETGLIAIYNAVNAGREHFARRDNNVDNH